MKKTTRYATALMILSMAILPLRAMADTPTITLVTEQYPPYNMTDRIEGYAHNEDDIGGLCTDIILATFAKANMDFRIKLRNWDYGMSRVLRKKDNALFCTVRSEQRESLFKWVGPITHMQLVLLALENSDIELSSLEDAKKYTVGGYKSDAFTQRMIDQGLNVSSVLDDSLNPARLQQGAIDLWVADALAGPYKAAETTDIENLKVALKLSATPVYLAFNPTTDDVIINRLQNALDLLKSEGVVAGLEADYGL